MLLDDLLRISKNSIGFSLGTILSQGIGFILLPIYTRFLTPADYGILSVTSVIASILMIILIFGQRGSMTRFYYDVHEDKNKLKKYLSTIVILTLIISLFATTMLYFFGESLFSSFIPDVSFKPYITIVLGISFLSIPLSFVLVLLQVREKAIQHSTINILQFIITTIFIIYFVVIAREGALGSLKGQFISTAIFFIIALFLLKNDIGLNIDFNKFSKNII